MIRKNTLKYLERKRRNYKFRITKRNNFLRFLEDEIQLNALEKDSKFKLRGKWKKYYKRIQKFKVYKVDGEWIRNNLCVYFGHGGHGLVHEFIPLDEIWISTHHYNSKRNDFASCGCKTSRPDQEVSKLFFESTMMHEIWEFNEMLKGKDFIIAHRTAIMKEKENYGNPFIDIVTSTDDILN